MPPLKDITAKKRIKEKGREGMGAGYATKNVYKVTLRVKGIRSSLESATSAALSTHSVLFSEPPDSMLNCLLNL